MIRIPFPAVWRLFMVALFCVILTTALLAPTRPANAQDSPLPTPTAGAPAPSPLSSPTPVPTSPLPTPTAGNADPAGQPISNTVASGLVNATPTPLAGTALTSPGAIAVIVLVALAVVGAVVRRRQRNR